MNACMDEIALSPLILNKEKLNYNTCQCQTLTVALPSTADTKIYDKMRKFSSPLQHGLVHGWSDTDLDDTHPKDIRLHATIRDIPPTQVDL